MVQSSIRPVRLIDVAAKAGVSRIVAGHVLLGSGGKTTRVSDATAQRIREAAAALDYRPNFIARQLSGVRTRTLAALIGADRYQVHYDRLRAIDREADRRGFRLMVGYLHGPDIVENLTEQFNEFEGRGVEGFVLQHRFRKMPERLIQRMTAANLVACQKQPTLPEVCCVDIDLALGTEMLVDHLVERGRRRLALLVPGEGSARRRGFERAAQRHHLGHSAVLWADHQIGDTHDVVEIRRHIERMLNEYFKPGEIDAIMAPDDLWAVQLIKALLAREVHVPRDVAITGIDNVDIAAACNPELTTIDQCNDAVAQKVMDLIEHLIAGKRLPTKQRHITLDPRLVIRQST